MMIAMKTLRGDQAEAQVRAAAYARLSETYDAAESVPTQIDRSAVHAKRRGWELVASFKDDGYSGFKEITRDGFTDLIAAIERDIDVVIVRDVDRLNQELDGLESVREGMHSAESGAVRVHRR